ncbi:MAG: rRNA pseudouridine synthase [Clostridia bacterium]|nr:rRNA pseudouridine synthase [Clostridia bacterium]
MKERLDKIISSRCLLTRSEAAKAIRRGRVSVDGIVCTVPDTKVSASEQTVTLDGQSIRSNRYLYIMMNKPAGVLSATEDKNCQTVLDLLPEEYARRGLGVVGRLDKDATGLLLLTDDGVLNHRLTSPKSHAPKLYHVISDGMPKSADIETFAAGMDLGDFVTKSAKLTICDGYSLVEISEGKFHQVKRMFQKIGLNVLALKRLSIASLRLPPDLAEGEWRILSDGEISELCAF